MLDNFFSPFVVLILHLCFCKTMLHCRSQKRRRLHFWQWNIFSAVSEICFRQWEIFSAGKYIFSSQWNIFSAVKYIFSSEIYFRQSVEYVFGSRWNVFSAVSEIYFWQSVEYQKEIRAGWQRDCKHVINCRKFLHRKILPPWVHLRSSNAKRLVMVMKKVAYILYSKCI